MKEILGVVAEVEVYAEGEEGFALCEYVVCLCI